MNREIEDFVREHKDQFGAFREAWRSFVKAQGAHDSVDDPPDVRFLEKWARRLNREKEPEVRSFTRNLNNQNIARFAWVETQFRNVWEERTGLNHGEYTRLTLTFGNNFGQVFAKGPTENDYLRMALLGMQFRLPERSKSSWEKLANEVLAQLAETDFPSDVHSVIAPRLQGISPQILTITMIAQEAPFGRPELEWSNFWSNLLTEVEDSWRRAEDGIYQLLELPSFRELLLRNGYSEISKQAREPMDESKGGAQGPQGPAEPTRHGLNTILYGPPGTGKTYSTKARAVSICNNKSLKRLQESENRAELLREFKELVDKRRVAFVTFHQSYGYEEFVEGIRPVLGRRRANSSDQEPTYELVDGIFKEMATRALFALIMSDHDREFDFVWNLLFGPHESREPFTVHSTTGSEYFVIASDDGSSLRWHSPESPESVRSISREHIQQMWIRARAERLEPEALPSDLAEWFGGTKHNYSVFWGLYQRLHALAEHPDYDAVCKAVTRWRETSGKLPDSATAPPYVLIVDEINRGNISKILGELITLLEPTKRLAPAKVTSATGIGADPLRVRLPYSNEEFQVPSNLNLIGTMNTADRSIALLDTALRRRFTFEELMPKEKALRKMLQDAGSGEDWTSLVCAVFTSINQRVLYLYDRDHQIGHSYFKDATSPDALKQALLDSVIPLLQEYFYGSWEQLASVLGCPWDRSANGWVQKRQSHRILDTENEPSPKFLDPSSFGAEPVPAFKISDGFLKAKGKDLRPFFDSILGVQAESGLDGRTQSDEESTEVAE